METETAEGKRQETATEGPGRMLFGAREQRGISIEEAAKALNLSPKHITALEADDYEALAGPTYIRGYLRGYALYLGLDPEAMIRRYNVAHAPSEETPDLGALTPPPQVSSNDRLVKLGTVVVAGLVFGMAVIWWVGREESRPATTNSATSSVVPTETTAAPPVDPVTPGALGEDLAVKDITEAGQSVIPPEDIDQSAEATPTAPERATRKPPGSAPTRIPAEGNQATPPATAALQPESPRPPATPPPAAVSSPITSPATRARLVIRTTQESWIDIRDARQSKLLYETLAAGRTVTVEGVAPLNVFIGNAEGVSVEYDGELYDTSPFRRGQVARFSLPPPRSSNSGLLGP